jgi:hypothetical protein
MQKRPPQGYTLKSELLTRGVLTRQEYDTVKDFLCIHTYSDNQVANPVPLSVETKDKYYMDFEDRSQDPAIYQTRPGYPGNIICRYGRGKINNFRIGSYSYTFNYPRNSQPLVFGRPIYGLQELSPCYIEITSRAPVNINTAPRQILIALLSELEGFFVLEQIRKATGEFANIKNELFKFFTLHVAELAP